MNGASHYAILGGTNPLTEKEIKEKFVDVIFGKDNYRRTARDEEYYKLLSTFERGEMLYKSLSGQGSVVLSKDGKIMKVSYFTGYSIDGCFFIKK